jgi:hypothetical protein
LQKQVLSPAVECRGNKLLISPWLSVHQSSAECSLQFPEGFILFLLGIIFPLEGQFWFLQFTVTENTKED